jgi:predicted component of type VI protein secretion system
LLERKVSSGLDLNRLKDPGMKLRIEARIRVSDAPRRVNLQLFTQRTTDYHSNLMEFDIPDTNNWHVISWTPPDFDARPGDTITAHMALMDWGLEKYRVDVDYIKLDVVNTATAGPDQGVLVPFHPQTSDPRSFTQQVKVAQDSVIDIINTDINLNNWFVRDGDRKINLLSVNAGQDVILRWDLSVYAGRQVADYGLLELTTHSVERCSDDIADYGLIRVVEILGGDPKWDQKTVTADSLCMGQPLSHVLNSQMIIDRAVTEGDGGKTYIPISKIVLQRMIDGKTPGIAIKSLGAIHAGFYSMENDDGKKSAKLLFNLRN